jgi:hypothetical protein
MILIPAPAKLSNATTASVIPEFFGKIAFSNINEKAPNSAISNLILTHRSLNRLARSFLCSLRIRAGASPGPASDFRRPTARYQMLDDRQVAMERIEQS